MNRPLVVAAGAAPRGRGLRRRLRTAVLVIDGTRTPIAPGSIASVPAGVPHRVEEVGEDLQVVVVSPPPES